MTEEDAKLRSELEDQLQFEMLLTEISARFVNLPTEMVECEIQDAQRRICESLHFDRSTMWQISGTNWHEVSLTHLYQYQCDGWDIHPIPDYLAASESAPWTTKKILSGHIVAITKIEDLGPEAARDREFYLLYGTKSTAVIPLMAGGVVMGMMAFATIGEERSWPKRLLQRLQVVAEVFANAIARKRGEQALRESEARLSLAAEAAGTGLWILNFETSYFWTTPKVKELLGLAPNEELTFERFINLIHPEDRDRIREGTQLGMKSQEISRNEFRVVLADGNVRWIVSLGRPYSSSSVDPKCLMGVSIDITRRKETERSLEKAYEKIQQLKDKLEAENIYLRSSVSTKSIHKNIIGQSNALKKVLRRVEQVAPTDAAVLITGETGTGKELVAEAIHNLSKRKDGLLVKVNCASLPASLMESELFGREKGAYTGAVTKQIGRFELADHSTLFLDEITELPLELQVKLLRVLQNREFERLGNPKTIRVDVRVIAATNRDIGTEAQKGTFRKDLYYRLNVFPIEVPPLRERLDDIPVLVDAFVREFSGKMGKKILTIPKKTMDALQQYHWPGNIRELRNVVEHGVIISSGTTLYIPLPKMGTESVSAKTRTLEEAEYQHITEILNRTGWRIKGPHGAALVLGIKPSSLYAKMKKLGIPTRYEKDNIRYEKNIMT
jgi:formate hydrogenlyase transcriptional activator